MIYKSYILENNDSLIKKNNSILFYGENLGLIEDFKKRIKKLNNNKEFINFNQDEILKNEDLLLDEIQNVSLFGKEKIFFVNHVSDKIFKIVEKILNKNIDSNIFLFAGLLEKKNKIRNYFEKSKQFGIVPCYSDNEISLKKIVLSKLKDFQGLNPYNLNLILESCNLDRMKLMNELDKIEIFFENKTIESKELEILLNSKINEDFNILKDEALSGNSKKTNKLLNETVIDDEKNILYLSQINQRLNKLSEAHQMAKNTQYKIEKIIDHLKPPIFWKDKQIFINQFNKLNSKKIKSILNDTYNLEIKFKLNSIINKRILIKKLLIDICLLANS